MDGISLAYLDLTQVLSISPYRSKTVLWGAMKKGEFPQPDRIGGRSLWRSDLVDQAIKNAADRAEAERKAAAGKATARSSKMLARKAEEKTKRQAAGEGGA